MDLASKNETFEELMFLGRAPTRIALLRLLNENASCSRDDLQNEIDADRTTIQRNLDALIDHDWVRQDVNEYGLTLTGEAIVEELDGLLAVIEATNRLQPFLTHVSTEAFDLDVRHLRDADMTVATPADPYAPLNAHLRAVRRFHEIKVLLPMLNREAVEMGIERARQADVTMEAVISPRVASVLSSDPSYAPLAEEVDSIEGLEIFVANRRPSFYLGCFDTTVQVGVADESGKPHALVETDREAVREWATEMYAAYRADADRLTSDR